MLRSPRARAAALGSFLAGQAAAAAVQPSVSAAETIAFVLGVPVLLEFPPPIRPVPVLAAEVPRPEKVVLVVDESVNHRVYEQVVAPALTRLPALDFGEAASVGTCRADW